MVALLNLQSPYIKGEIRGRQALAWMLYLTFKALKLKDKSKEKSKNKPKDK